MELGLLRLMFRQEAHINVGWVRAKSCNGRSHKADAIAWEDWLLQSELRKITISISILLFYTCWHLRLSRWIDSATVASLAWTWHEFAVLHRSVSKYPSIDYRICDGIITVLAERLTQHYVHDPDIDLVARPTHTTMLAKRNYPSPCPCQRPDCVRVAAGEVC